MIQFHPTGMTHPQNMVGWLVSEAVRGEGGKLFNEDRDRFMENYDEDRMELSTRDIIARANFREIHEGRGSKNDGVYLDISHKGKDFILDKLPKVWRQFIENQNVDISEKKMEVAPTAHYSMGGIKVDAASHQTNIDGLYAVGECTSGVHGANRLGGNSLIETVVFGKVAGEAASRYSEKLPQQYRDTKKVEQSAQKLYDNLHEGKEMARPLMHELQEGMYKKCGVIRTEEKMKEQLKEVRKLKERATKIDVRLGTDRMNFINLAVALNVQSACWAAEATLISALARKESRGAHYREDFQNSDDDYLVNFTLKLKDGKLKLDKTKAKGTPKSLQKYLPDGDYESEGRLQAAKKEMLAEVLHNKNYERTAQEFKMALGKENYQPNLISPKKIKKLIKHIDLTEENQIEDLIGYQELQTGLIWMFGILMVHQFLKQTKQSISIPKDPRKPISFQSHIDT